MSRRLRLLGGLGALALALVALGWLTSRTAHRAGEGGREPPGPRQVIMSQRLSQQVPWELAGLQRRKVLVGSAALAEIERLAGQALPLTDGCVGFYGDPVALTLWAGAALSAAAARQIVGAQQVRLGATGDDGRDGEGSGVVRATTAAGPVAVFAAGPRVFGLHGGADRIDAALEGLRQEH